MGWRRRPDRAPPAGRWSRRDRYRRGSPVPSSPAVQIADPPTESDLDAEQAARDATYWANAKAEWEAGRARDGPLAFDHSRYVR